MNDHPESLRRSGNLFDATPFVAQVCDVMAVSSSKAIWVRLHRDEVRHGRAEEDGGGIRSQRSICITEDAGSAATEMTTRADKKGDKYIINGKKHWITGAGASRLHLVFARVFDEQGEEQGIGGFLGVRDETPGLSIGNREPTMGLRGIPEAEVIMQDMEVGEDALVMPPRGLRKGFADLMDAYNSQRVGAGTMALGIAQGAYQHALDYVQEREQFGRPIYEFQGLQWMLADMAIQIDCAQLMLYRAAANAGDGFPTRRKAKVIAADMVEGHQMPPTLWARDIPADSRWAASATVVCSRSAVERQILPNRRDPHHGEAAARDGYSAEREAAAARRRSSIIRGPWGGNTSDADPMPTAADPLAPGSRQPLPCLSASGENDPVHLRPDGNCL